MVDSLSLLRGAWVVLAALLLVLLLEVRGWRHDGEYDAALRRGDYAAAAEQGVGRWGQAARAYALADDDFDAKVLAYARLSAGGEASDAIARDARYNLANLYLRRALTLDVEADRDMLVPLVEQAKQLYRNLLAVDPGHYEAKYNLELALLLLPEGADVPADEERNPERSERAISTMRVEEQLP